MFRDNNTCIQIMQFIFLFSLDHEPMLASWKVEFLLSRCFGDVRSPADYGAVI